MRRAALFGMACANALLLCSCGTDVGKCDMNALGGSTVLGMEAPNAGQIVVEQACAGGRCHSAAAQGLQRVGAPAGLNFDVVPHDTSMPEIARVTQGEKVVHDNIDTMWSMVDSGAMPPENQGRMFSAQDKETLRNWLACGAPVIKAPVQATADWSSIYNGLTSNGCLACHGSASPVGDNFVLSMSAMDACTAYKNIVSKPSITTQGGCASSGLQVVVPGQPDMSLLVQKLEGTQTCGSAMPLGTTGLGPSNPTVMALRAWITNGAPPPAGCM